MKNSIGISLCVLGVCGLFVFFRSPIVALIPVLLYILTLFIKKKVISYFLNAIIPLFLLFVYGVFRISSGEHVEITSRISYHVVDFGHGDMMRHAFELALQNRRIFLADSKDTAWLYVSEDDYNKLHPESWSAMKARGYTFRATWKYKNLLLGGNSVAQLIKYEKISEQPVITK